MTGSTWWTERSARARAVRAAVAVLMLTAGVCAALADPAAASTIQPYGDGASSDDARLGAQIGAGAAWHPAMAPLGGAGSGIGFGGNARLSCNGIDFNAFLRSFDPNELLNEMRNSIVSGAQAAVSNYLIALAYSSPTLVSVLDMMDKRYSARFAAFAQACDAQAARARGLDEGARRMAEAGDQCFAQEIERGTGPTEAYRRCSIARSFESIDLPAAASTLDFLRRYTNLDVTREIEALLALIPDERIEQGRYEMRPAQLTVASMSERLRLSARDALDRIDAGADPSTIAACGAGTLLDPAPAAGGCLPAAAAALIASPAFRSARLLGAPARELVKDALAGQIAASAMYSNLLELFEQTARLDVRQGTGAAAEDTLSRRRRLHEEIGRLLTEADTLVKAQEARARLARTQLFALERAEAGLEAQAAALDAERARPGFGMRDLLRVFGGGGASAQQ